MLAYRGVAASTARRLSALLAPELLYQGVTGLHVIGGDLNGAAQSLERRRVVPLPARGERRQHLQTRVRRPDGARVLEVRRGLIQPALTEPRQPAIRPPGRLLRRPFRQLV